MHHHRHLPALFALLTHTHADPVHPRAGAPEAIPIPANCTLSNPLPDLPSSPTYRPSDTFLASALLYNAFYTSPLPPHEQVTQCQQQCYGYGDSGECKAVFFAHDVVVPAGYHGAEEKGGAGSGCWLFGEEFGKGDLVAVGAGEGWTGVVARDLVCPEC